ncbi:MAG: hypothetical protein MUO21_07410, partial [Nitrososphaeraceae archaeon]|nr:hypothetical protein [Nitrososphaeraceae archaeon]
NFFKINTLIKIPEEYRKAKEKMRQINVNKDDISKYNLKYFDSVGKLDVHDRVLACIIMGFQLNTAVQYGSGYHTKFYKGDKVRINKMSVLMEKSSLPKNVVYYELFISMGQMNLSIVSQVPNKIIEALS